MIFHPAINDVNERLAKVNKALAGGVLTPEQSWALQANYAYRYKDHQGNDALAIAHFGGVELPRVNEPVGGGDGLDGPFSNEDEADTIWFTVTTFTEDRDGDVVVPLGRQGKAYELNPVWFLGHQQWEIPIGTAWTKDRSRVQIIVTEDRIKQACRFDREDPDADFVYGKVLRGMLNGSSLAFVPIEAYRRDRAAEKGIVEAAHPHSKPDAPLGWWFAQWEHTETSVVGVPSNAGATVEQRELRGALRDALDREKRFITPRCQKALTPYCATTKGGWNGWCPGPECGDPLRRQGVKATPLNVKKGKLCGCSDYKAKKPCPCGKQQKADRESWDKPPASKQEWLKRLNEILERTVKRPLSSFPQDQVDRLYGEKATPQQAAVALANANRQPKPTGTRGRHYYDPKTGKDANGIVAKYIRLEGSSWVVHAEDGKVLGKHPTKERAEAQLAAVEANKHGTSNKTVTDSEISGGPRPAVDDKALQPPTRTRPELGPNNIAELVFPGQTLLARTYITVNGQTLAKTGEPLTVEQVHGDGFVTVRNRAGQSAKVGPGKVRLKMASKQALATTSGQAGGYTVPTGHAETSPPGNERPESSALLCVECGGTGNCRACSGEGSTGAGACRICGGSGECPECVGMGKMKSTNKPQRKGNRSQGESMATRKFTRRKAADDNPPEEVDEDLETQSGTHEEEQPEVEKDEEPEEEMEPPPVVPKYAKMMGYAYNHAKAEQDWLDGDLAAAEQAHKELGHEGTSPPHEALQKYAAKHVAGRMEHLKDMFAKHHPDLDLDEVAGQAATEAKGLEQGGEDMDFGEEGAVQAGRVPPDSVKGWVVKGRPARTLQEIKDAVRRGDAYFEGEKITKVDDDGRGNITWVNVEGGKGYMTLDPEWVTIGKGHRRKSVPGSDEWAAEEADEPEHTHTGTGKGEGFDEINEPAAEYNKGQQCSCGYEGDTPYCPMCGEQMKGEGADDIVEGPAGYNDGGEGKVEGDGTTDQATEEIMERYQGKDGSWYTKTHRLRRTKSGRAFLVREKAVRKADVATEDERRLDGEMGVGKDMGMEDDEKCMAVKEAGDFLKDMSDDEEVPKGYRHAAKGHSRMLGQVHKALTNSGKVQRDGGPGSPLTDEGTAGNKGSMKDEGETQASQSANKPHEEYIEGTGKPTPVTASGGNSLAKQVATEHAALMKLVKLRTGLDPSAVN